MYSQNNEEHYILEAFAGVTDGKFLDIGAFDGKMFSNTLALVERGWSGVSFEPSPTVFPALLNLHGENPKITLVNTAVTPGGGMLQFWDSGGDAVSTTSLAHKHRWEAGSQVKFKPFFVQSISLSDALARFGTEFEFVGIDVEGGNIDLFRALPFEQLTKTKMICVEHDGHAQEMANIAEAFGFRVLHTNPENLILVR